MRELLLLCGCAASHFIFFLFFGSTHCSRKKPLMFMNALSSTAIKRNAYARKQPSRIQQFISKISQLISSHIVGIHIYMIIYSYLALCAFTIRRWWLSKKKKENKTSRTNFRWKRVFVFFFLSLCAARLHIYSWRLSILPCRNDLL